MQPIVHTAGRTIPGGIRRTIMEYYCFFVALSMLISLMCASLGAQPTLLGAGFAFPAVPHDLEGVTDALESFALAYLLLKHFHGGRVNLRRLAAGQAYEMVMVGLAHHLLIMGMLFGLSDLGDDPVLHEMGMVRYTDALETLDPFALRISYRVCGLK